MSIFPDGFGRGYGWQNFPSDYKVTDSMPLSWFYEGKSQLAAYIAQSGVVDATAVFLETLDYSIRYGIT